ncbi:MAG: general secretion pathway protein GspB [Pseudomarimonas sp.]
MSLILEALRKSEAERQMGRAPGLLTPMSMGPVEPSRRRWWWVGLVIALVVIAIALAWWLGRNGQLGANEAAPAVVASAAAPTPRQLPAVVAAPNDTQPAAATPITTPPAATRPMPAAGPADFPSDPDFESTERESLPLPAPVSTPPPTPTAPVTTTQPPAAITAVASTPASATAPKPAPIEPPAIAVADVPATTPLSALSEAERAGLPPLRLNMHVFNAEPSRRFVMIDGKRHAEGDPLAAEVKLVEIRREGAVVDIRGRLILIQRP